MGQQSQHIISDFSGGLAGKTFRGRFGSEGYTTYARTLTNFDINVDGTISRRHGTRWAASLASATVAPGHSARRIFKWEGVETNDGVDTPVVLVFVLFVGPLTAGRGVLYCNTYRLVTSGEDQLEFLCQNTCENPSFNPADLSTISSVSIFMLPDFPFLIFMGKNTRPFVLFHERFPGFAYSAITGKQGAVILPSELAIPSGVWRRTAPYSAMRTDKWFMVAATTGRLNPYGANGNDAGSPAYIPAHDAEFLQRAPTTISVWNASVVCGGFPTYPRAVFFSRISHFNDFTQALTRDATDGAGAEVSLAENAQVRWLEPYIGANQQSVLMIGCSSGIYVCGSPHVTTYTKPQAWAAPKILNYGCDFTRPIQFGSIVVYVQEGRKMARIAQFSNELSGYNSPDITGNIQTELETELIKFIVPRFREKPGFYLVCDSGTVYSCYVSPAQMKVGYSKIETPFKVEDIAVPYYNGNEQPCYAGDHVYLENRTQFVDSALTIRLPDLQAYSVSFDQQNRLTGSFQTTAAHWNPVVPAGVKPLANQFFELHEVIGPPGARVLAGYEHLDWSGAQTDLERQRTLTETERVFTPTDNSTLVPVTRNISGAFPGPVSFVIWVKLKTNLLGPIMHVQSNVTHDYYEADGVRMTAEEINAHTTLDAGVWTTKISEPANRIVAGRRMRSTYSPLPVQQLPLTQKKVLEVSLLFYKTSGMRMKYGINDHDILSLGAYTVYGATPDISEKMVKQEINDDYTNETDIEFYTELNSSAQIIFLGYVYDVAGTV